MISYIQRVAQTKGTKLVGLNFQNYIQLSLGTTFIARKARV